MNSPLETPVKNAPPVILPVADAASPSKVSDVVALCKPRVTVLVWLTTLFGMVIAAGVADLHVGLALATNTLVGSLLVISSANIFNQVIEKNPDSRMKRTRNRPIATGRISTLEGTVLGFSAALVGLSELYFFVNPLTALLGALSIFLYACVYTPLKPRTHLATAVGAIPGAIPPLAGWVAVTGSISAPAVFLFGLQFLWQFPHFWAIAWLLRDDYSLAGFKMLPFPEANGTATGIAVLQYAGAALPLSLALSPYVAHPAVYIVGAALLGIWLVSASYKFLRNPDDPHARKVLKASIAYLPLLLLLVVCVL
jgi:protoheme IX farnesyltransferase